MLRWSLCVSIVTCVTAVGYEGGKLECVKKYGRKGICVRSYDCDPTTGEIPQTIVLNPRFGGEDECPHFKDVCCLPAGSKSLPYTIPTHEQKMPCGYSNPLGASAFRMVQNNDSRALTSEYSEFPWTIALLRAEDLSNIRDRYIGGGSLIHPRVVLTAASKVAQLEPSDIICRAGEWDLLDLEQYPHVDKEVEHIIWHERYFFESLNNVALLILKSSVIINEDTPHLAIACLGKGLPPPGTVCQATGWGKKNLGDNEISAILKKVSVPLVRHNICQRELRHTRLGPHFHLKRSMFLCAAGDTGIDTCDADGGLPLVCNIKCSYGSRSRYAVYGMVSWGVGCGDGDVPGVYMKVPHYIGWIKHQLAAHGLDTTYFNY